MGDLTTCPACGSSELEPAGAAATRRAVCGHCGRCWEREEGGHEVDILACAGCLRRGTCEARPTWLAESLTQRHVLADGAQVLIRPLVYGDRFELATKFSELSLRSRQLRFFRAPDALGPEQLEYLTNIDYQNHFAMAAALVGDRVAPNGIAVGRYLRDPADPEIAEVAVTVVDAHQRRGVGTLLTRALGEVAAQRGVRTFISYVQWDNDLAVDSLRREGARVVPAEPGVARIEIDLPFAAPDSFVHRLLGRLRAPKTPGRV